MGRVYGEDYGVFTIPGTEGWFGMCIDGFVVSNDSADVEAGLRWAYTMVPTPDVQTAFSTLKESVSPYTDTPDEHLQRADPAIQRTNCTAETTNVYPQLYPRHRAALERPPPDLQTQIHGLCHLGRA